MNENDGRGDGMSSDRDRFGACVRRAAVGVIALLLTAGPASALKERSEEGFPLVITNDRVDVGASVGVGEERELEFEVTNPTDETLTYFVKSSTRTVRVPFEEIDIAPGETQTILVRFKPRIPGPFRHRIGVVIEPLRGALFIQGVVPEPEDS